PPSRQPSARPSTISAASDSTLTDVSTVWISAATRTPRTLIHVSAAIDAIASMRCADKPTAIGPLGRSTVVPTNTSADRAGTNTAVNFANPTATAAIVPVWMTVNSVHPYRKPNSGEIASRRYTYWPPARGNCAASSPYVSAPSSVTTPAHAHTSSSR